MILAAALGAVALGLVVFGLIYGKEALLTALTIDGVLLWIVTTVHHATWTLGSRHRHAHAA